MMKSFLIPRSLITGYASLSLLFSIVIGAQAFSKGWVFSALVLLFYCATVVISSWKSREALPYIAALALLSGWMETTFPGYNLDISAGILCLGVAVALLSIKHDRQVRLHPAAVALLLISLLVLISLIFVYFRIISFAPAPGFSYQNYAVNLFGLSSDNVILNVLMKAANLYSWFGLLFLALNYPFSHNKSFTYIVLFVLAANTVVVLAQLTWLPDFLVPPGQVAGNRHNGLTSFSYALGAAMEILFLLAPLWFRRKRELLALSVATVLMILFGTYFSGSRTALLVIAISSTGWLLILMYRKLPWLRVARISLIIGTIAALFVVSYLAIDSLPADPGTATGRLARYARQEGFLESAYHGRAEQYPLIFSVISRYPAIGLGVGSFHYQIANYQELYRPGLVPLNSYVMQSNAPNTYLGIAAELGLPALLLFIFAIIRIALERSHESGTYSLRSYFLLTGLLVYSFGLIVGPQLYNSEAAPWFWILCGGIVWSRKNDSNSSPQEADSHRWRITASALVSVSVVYIILNLIAQGGFDPNRQWAQLRWHLNIGFFPTEETGQWSGPQAAMLLEKGRFARIRWHAGAKGVKYKADVKFYLEGKVVLNRPAGGGKIDTTLLVMPGVPEDKRLFAISVEPPFIPADFGFGDDHRRLGIFLHSIEMLEKLDDWIGFYAEETNSTGRNFRWCAREGYVPLPEARAWRISVRSLRIPKDKTPVTLSVKINGVTLKSIELSNRWTEVTLTREDFLKVLGGGDTGPVAIHLESDRTYRPIDILGVDDDRELAFAVTTPEPPDQ